ncbi:efflux RND transporter periplasmic adaptor subunit [Olivibacter sitiensis]|uniref:efflux RND transporter periplasmic adaptor subunit n=1 Tax=Olivibacter sitiensis TaxID=376470 RepID=UPI000407A030|nr:efflux RND transporter periplasmic adaptor subunit [Olivibacter sitiensis]
MNKANAHHHWTRWNVLLMSFVVIIISACHSSGNDGEEKVQEESGRPLRQAFRLEKGDLNTSFRIPGELMAFQQVDIYAKVNSFVKKLYVDVGSEVQQGQLLATMEAPELNSQLAGAESRLKSQEAVYLASKATYERLLETSKTPGTISQNDLDIALSKQKSDFAQFNAAEASYREIKDNMGYLEIRAPFSGIISARNVSSGAYVGPSGKGSDLPIFTLQQQNKLRLVVTVPEVYTSYLHRDAEVSFRVKAKPNQVFKAQVSRMAGALDSRLRSQRVEMDVDNQSKVLLPGMIAEVDIPLKGAERNFVVPSTAVLNSTQGLFVVKVVNNKAVWVPISLGRSADGKSEVFGELQENDHLLSVATEEVRNDDDLGQLEIVGN